MRDLASLIAVSAALFPAIATATPTAAVVDRRGYDSVTLALQTGIGGITFTGTNKLEWLIEHSDDNVTFTAITGSHILGASGGVGTVTVTAGVVESYVVAKAAASTNHYAYIGDKRYIRLTPVFGGTHGTGTTVGATAILGHPQNAPAA